MCGDLFSVRRVVGKYIIVNFLIDRSLSLDDGGGWGVVGGGGVVGVLGMGDRGWGLGVGGGKPAIADFAIWVFTQYIV